MSLPEYTTKPSGAARTYSMTREVGSPLIFAPATEGISASSASWAGVTVVVLRAPYR